LLGQKINRQGDTRREFGSSQMQATNNLYRYTMTRNITSSENDTDHVDWPRKQGDRVFDDIYDTGMGTAMPPH
jgi:hypothetical protein